MRIRFQKQQRTQVAPEDKVLENPAGNLQMFLSKKNPKGYSQLKIANDFLFTPRTIVLNPLCEILKRVFHYVLSELSSVTLYHTWINTKQLLLRY